LPVVSDDLAIDLGTANTLIYRRGEGVVSDEPSVIAFRGDRQSSRQVLAIGADAKKMLGRTSSSITVTRPLRNGVIADFEATQVMLRHFLGKVQKRRLRRPRVVICVPSAITQMECRAVKESAESVGARETVLVAEPIAAAIGAGLLVSEPVGSMIVDVGGGTTEVAVLSLGAVVSSQSLRVAGDTMDEAIVGQIRNHYNIQIGERTAELIKLIIGSVLPDTETRTLLVGGRDLSTGMPSTFEISDEDIREALKRPVNEFVESVRTVLSSTPPELMADIMDKGMTLAGGGALLRNLADLLTKETGLPVKLASVPLRAVVMGAGKLLDEPSLLRKVAIG
jgi:rod shape-determining protein MreB